MPTIDGIELDNATFGWTHRATSEPLPSYENDLSDLKRAGRDGVVSIPGTTSPVLLRIVVQTPRTGLESLASLFKQGRVWETGGREAAMEFRSMSPTGFGPADQIIDATFVIRLPGAFMRATINETTPIALASASHALACFAARPVGLVSQWQNLSTNPSFEAPGATVIVRTNYDTNPRPVANVTGWTTTGPTATLTPTAAGAQIDVPTAGTVTVPLMFHSANLPAVAGQRWSAARELSVPPGFPAVPVTLRVYSYGDNKIIADSGTVTIQPGQTITLAAPSTDVVGSATTGVRSILYGGGTFAANSRIVVSRTQTEPVSVPGALFDGGSQAVPDPDLSTRWQGTPNASPSELIGVGVLGLSGITGVVPVRSSLSWPGRQGSFSLRLIPVSSTNNVSYVVVPFPSSLMTVAGTAIITAHQEAALSGSLWSLRGRVYANPGTVLAPSTTPNSAGATTEHRVAFPAGSGNIVLPHGGLVGSGDVWYDLVTLVAGTYAGPGFTGATTPPDRLSTIVWDGLADQSSSTWTTHASWDGGLSAPVQDAVLRIKGPATGIQVTDSSGAWVVLPDTPAGTWSRFEADTGRCFQTTTDTWTGGTEVSGSCDFGGPRGVFEIIPVMAPGDPGSRSGQLTVATATRPGAVFEVRGKAAYLL